METEEKQPQELALKAPHPTFADQVISEYDLCVLLGISGQTLDSLRRDKGLPVVYLNKTNRVYLTSAVLDWIRGRAQR